MKTKTEMGCVVACLFAAALANGEGIAREGMAAVHEMVDRPAAEEAGWSGMALAPGITLDGLLEISGVHEDWEDKTSDLNLDTVEFSLSAELREGLRGEVVFLWEEEADEDVVVDSAVIEYGGTEAFPVVLGAGRMYLGFGSFNSMMVSDPLTLSLGEIRTTALSAFYAYSPVSLWGAVFGGEREDDDGIDNAAVALSFSPINEVLIGVSAVTDVGEGGYADEIDEVLGEGGAYERAAGLSTFFYADLEWVVLSAEYLAAAEDLAFTSVDGEVSACRPKAWFIEIGRVFTESWSGALRYEGSRSFMPEEMPERQFGGVLSYAFNEFAVLSGEYLFGEFDVDVEDRHLATLKLAVSF